MIASRRYSALLCFSYCSDDLIPIEYMFHSLLENIFESPLSIFSISGKHFERTSRNRISRRSHARSSNSYPHMHHTCPGSYKLVVFFALHASFQDIVSCRRLLSRYASTMICWCCSIQSVNIIIARSNTSTTSTSSTN